MSETPTERRLREMKLGGHLVWNAEVAAIDKGRQAIALLRELRSQTELPIPSAEIDALLTACQEDEG